MKRHREKYRKKIWKKAMILMVVVLAIVGGAVVLKGESSPVIRRLQILLQGADLTDESGIELPGWIDRELIPVDGTSRRGEKLDGIVDIVIHYVGNPGTTAEQNRSWYLNSASEVSSHFLVGLEGEIIQCIPLDEKSSATNWRNNDTISVEVCHPDETGKFNDITYSALVELTAWLCETFELDTSHVIRHYDVTGKECPKYFVTNEDAWEKFKADVQLRLEREGV